MCITNNFADLHLMFFTHFKYNNKHCIKKKENIEMNLI